MLMRAALWILGVFCLFLVITGVGLAAFLAVEIHAFAVAANSSATQVVQTARSGWNTQPKQDRHHVNILLLGVDSMNTRGNVPPLTDSIQIVSLDLRTAQLTLFSLPRDLWHPTYKTKINAFFAYGHDRYPNDPAQFPREIVTELTGVPLHYTVILDMDTVAQVIDAIGGVEVNVPVAFIDNEFPREDVDVTKVHDPKLLYETVQFDLGKQTFTGKRALEYMRSRHAVGDQGTDDARRARQQQVIFALIDTFRHPGFYKDIPRLGRLYALYQSKFNAEVPMVDVIGILRTLAPVAKQFTMVQGSPSVYPDNPNGVIWHPPVTATDKQWAYTIRDTLKFQQEVYQVLGLEGPLPTPAPQPSGGK